MVSVFLQGLQGEQEGQHCALYYSLIFKNLVVKIIVPLNLIFLRIKIHLQEF